MCASLQQDRKEPIFGFIIRSWELWLCDHVVSSRRHIPVLYYSFPYARFETSSISPFCFYLELKVHTLSQLWIETRIIAPIFNHFPRKIRLVNLKTYIDISVPASSDDGYTVYCWSWSSHNCTYRKMSTHMAYN